MLYRGILLCLIDILLDIDLVLSGMCSSSARWLVAPTFVLGRLENLCFFTEIICWAHWISQVQSTEPPLICLRAQPWLCHLHLN